VAAYHDDRAVFVFQCRRQFPGAMVVRIEQQDTAIGGAQIGYAHGGLHRSALLVEQIQHSQYTGTPITAEQRCKVASFSYATSVLFIRPFCG